MKWAELCRNFIMAQKHTYGYFKKKKKKKKKKTKTKKHTSVYTVEYFAKLL